MTTNPEDPTGSLADAFAEFGRYAVDANDATHADPIAVTPDKHVIVRTLTGDRRLETLNLERQLLAPVRTRGSAALHEPQSFIDYVTRLYGVETTVWASEEAGSLCAVFNDHADAVTAGWRDHTAVLRLRPDPDWEAWTKYDGKLGSQEWFAEHLEDRATTIVSPSSSEMLTVAREFRAKRSASFERYTVAESGDVSLGYTETTTAKSGQKGEVEVPSEFTLRLSPFIGADPVEVVARLRYRINDGLTIGYRLLRPDLARLAAFAQVRNYIVERLPATVLVIDGQAPHPVEPSR